MRSSPAALVAHVTGLVVLFGCTSSPAPTGVARSQAALEEPPLVDTAPWLESVSDPPPAWRRFVEGRADVRRFRFVRFRRPETLPPARARFVVRPFPGTRFVLRTRRAGPVGAGAYSWFGAIEDDPRGYGGIVVRPNGRVAASISVDTRRFEVVNVGTNAYAILEMRPREAFRCGFDGDAPGGG